MVTEKPEADSVLGLTPDYRPLELEKEIHEFWEKNKTAIIVVAVLLVVIIMFNKPIMAQVKKLTGKKPETKTETTKKEGEEGGGKFPTWGWIAIAVVVILIIVVVAIVMMRKKKSE